MATGDKLRSYGVAPEVHDPMADADETRHEFGIELIGLDGQEPFDAVIYAVPHAAFESFSAADFARLCGTRDVAKQISSGILIDVKSRLDRAEVEGAGLIYWAL